MKIFTESVAAGLDGTVSLVPLIRILSATHIYIRDDHEKAWPASTRKKAKTPVNDLRGRGHRGSEMLWA